MSCILCACKGQVLEIKGPRQPGFTTITDSKTVVFIHGMYLTPASWRDWETYFQRQGYTTYSPAWPLHDLSVDEQNALHPSAELSALTLPMVLQHYRDFIATLPEPPILIGHSMGGLIVQKLLDEHVAAAGIAIDSAPPFGVFSVEPAFLAANLHIFNPSVSVSTPIKLSFKQFQYGFANGMTLEDQQDAYLNNVVPESRRIGRATLSSRAKVKTDEARAPLLIVASGSDHTATPGLNYTNFRLFKKTPAITDWRMFPGRNHWTIRQQGWEQVADYVSHWIDENKVPVGSEQP